MPNYDNNLFNPPAPLAKVILRHPQNKKEISDIPMLIDTGADVSLIPQTSVNLLQIEMDPTKVYELIGFDGNKSVAGVVQVELIFMKKTFKGQFLLTEQEWGILGRDILNHLSLLFDGPRLIWSEYRIPEH